MSGRPRTAIGTYGQVNVRRVGSKVVAETRHRDHDGRLRQVRATERSASAARALLKQRLLTRAGYGSGGLLSLASPFSDLVELWLADLALRDLVDSTKENYRLTLRLHVRPAFEHYTLGEITTGRVEWFLKSEAVVSHSRAKQSRTLLNLLFSFALRHDAIARNPVEGTSRLSKTKCTPQALSVDQITEIRTAAATWRTEPGLPGPPPDGQVRDIIEVLLGSAARPGEVLALRPCDVLDTPSGMILRIRGTVVHRTGEGTVRQEWPKTEASRRDILIAEFAATVIRRRLSTASDPASTIFASRRGGPLSPYNVRRTFRDFLKIAGLTDSGISLRWYRRTGATVIARSMGSNAAATYLGHTSAAVTEGHYIEPDPTVDPAPARHLELTLRPDEPDHRLLALPVGPDEEQMLGSLDDVEGATAS